MREDSDIKLVQALDKCENLQKENEKLKELLKQVNEHFDWVSYDDSFYVNYPLWWEIKKALGFKDEQLEMLQNSKNVTENVANHEMQHCEKRTDE